MSQDVPVTWTRWAGLLAMRSPYGPPAAVIYDNSKHMVRNPCCGPNELSRNLQKGRHAKRAQQKRCQANLTGKLRHAFETGCWDFVRLGKILSLSFSAYRSNSRNLISESFRLIFTTGQWAMRKAIKSSKQLILNIFMDLCAFDPGCEDQEIVARVVRVCFQVL